MSVGSGQLSTTPPPPEAAHDPIAIAAMVAELPDLEAKYLAAKQAAEEANTALDSMQQRIDAAIATLKHKAPKGSSWHMTNKAQRNGAQNIYIQALTDLLQEQQLRQQALEKIKRAMMSPPPEAQQAFNPLDKGNYR